MSELARSLALQARIGDVFGLKGTLGAGKTFFASEFINSLNANRINVLSPTFNLVYSYHATKCEVFHFDLYRLKSEEELDNIGFFESLKSGICLIEWPEIAQKFLRKNYTEIEILLLENEEREVRISLNLGNKLYEKFSA